MKIKTATLVLSIFLITLLPCFWIVNAEEKKTFSVFIIEGFECPLTINEFTDSGSNGRYLTSQKVLSADEHKITYTDREDLLKKVTTLRFHLKPNTDKPVEWVLVGFEYNTPFSKNPVLYELVPTDEDPLVYQLAPWMVKDITRGHIPDKIVVRVWNVTFKDGSSWYLGSMLNADGSPNLEQNKRFEDFFRAIPKDFLYILETSDTEDHPDRCRPLGDNIFSECGSDDGRTCIKAFFRKTAPSGSGLYKTSLEDCAQSGCFISAVRQCGNSFPTPK